MAGRGHPGAEEVREAKWIEVATPQTLANTSLAQACQSLGAGERGAILLAKGLSADLLLLDDWKARRVAQVAGLSMVGCLGILDAGARRAVSVLVYPFTKSRHPEAQRSGAEGPAVTRRKSRSFASLAQDDDFLGLRIHQL